MSLADEDSSLKVVDVVATGVEDSVDVGLGLGDSTKMDECSEKFQRGGRGLEAVWNFFRN